MTGLFLLLVVFVWVLFSVFISFLVSRRIESKVFKVILSSLIFIALLFVPLADEIIAKNEFMELCDRGTEMKFNKDSIVGKKVKLVVDDEGLVKDLWVDINEFSWRYLDVDSGLLMLSYKTYRAKGGWLIRFFGVSESDSPLIFNSECGPKNINGFLKDMNINVSYE